MTRRWLVALLSLMAVLTCLLLDNLFNAHYRSTREIRELKLDPRQIAWIEKNKNIRYAAWQLYDGRHDGQRIPTIGIAYLRLLEKRTGLHFVGTPIQSIEQAYTSLAAGKIDLIPDVHEKCQAKRFDATLLTVPYYTDSLAFVMR